ncbi:hypothetical protein CDAR_577591 [Caerostris darwini]|uniref:Uncharacterized protein n=1 Tax=Caerostris darwini TaxID=1538125 RepID=A0AAV4URB2_9ARAC|nr:hypothetical protein CDAR_577591 [Caerostris darwini]
MCVADTNLKSSPSFSKLLGLNLGKYLSYCDNHLLQQQPIPPKTNTPQVRKKKRSYSFIGNNRNRSDQDPFDTNTRSPETKKRDFLPVPKETRRVSHHVIYFP